MKLRIINNTSNEIDIKVDNQNVNVNQIVELEITNKVVDIMLENTDTSSININDNSCLITTNLSFKLLSDSDVVILTLTNIAHQYQNYTQYFYYLPQCINGKILDLTYCVNDKKDIKKLIMQHLKKQRKNHIFSLLKWCLFDTLLDGGILSVLLWFVFNIKVAVSCIIIIFIIELLISSIFLFFNKSRHRCLNWTNEKNTFDDIDYLIQHIQEFCAY